MPSPSLQPLQSSIGSFQVPENKLTAQGDPSRLGARQSRKRRMLIEEVHTGQGHSTSRGSLGRKKRLGNQTGSSRDDASSREQHEPQTKTPEWIETNAVPTSDDEERIHDVKKELDEEVLEVGSSQPLSDMILPDFVLRREASPHSSSRNTHHSSRLTDPADLTDTSIRKPATFSRPRHSDRKVSRTGSQDIVACIFTGLSKAQRDAFDQNIARVIEAGLLMEHIQDQPFSESTTHIITNVDPDVLKESGVGLCPRMLKYLYGMLSEPWIVRHEWFVDSTETATWLPLPQVDYAIQGDTQFGPAPGTQTRRDTRLRRVGWLFSLQLCW
ncbi:hypothetical protein EDD21DRAFT_195413 [Dissophora ornata]|nr:hypothetical protein EDD21DRAFT_195413 [Dissophora ornata]